MEQQPSSETAQAAVEKIRRKSYRELKSALNFCFFCFKTKEKEESCGGVKIIRKMHRKIK